MREYQRRIKNLPDGGVKVVHCSRGQGVAWGVMTQRVANTVAPIAIGAVLATGSFLQTVSFISIFLAATFIAALFLPETEGQILS